MLYFSFMEDISASFSADHLLALVHTKMPFGKYKNWLICDLPDYYLAWFLRNGGFPAGKLGAYMATVYEIKTNGLQEILKNLKQLPRQIQTK